MSIESLFRGHRTLRGVIDAVIEGRLGRTVADDPARPRAARLDIGCYALFGGEADRPAAESLVREARAPVEMIGPDDQAWRDLFVTVHGARLTDRPMRTFAAHALDRERIRSMQAPPPGYALRRIDASLAAQIGPALVPHALETFGSVREFLKQGAGFSAW